MMIFVLACYVRWWQGPTFDRFFELLHGLCECARLLLHHLHHLGEHCRGRLIRRRAFQWLTLLGRVLAQPVLAFRIDLPVRERFGLRINRGVQWLVLECLHKQFAADGRVSELQAAGGQVHVWP